MGCIEKLQIDSRSGRLTGQFTELSRHWKSERMILIAVFVRTFEGIDMINMQPESDHYGT
jgi:hypothetical protein